MSEKKNVFLIGDSIRIGYCETVKEQLKDIANVFYPDDNCRYTQYILVELGGWRNICVAKDIDYVYFNAGHWDAAHFSMTETSLTSISEYETNIKKIIKLIKNFFPNAKICFATTTPMNPVNQYTSCPRTNEEIRAYNEAGVRAANEMCAQVDDLYAFTEKWDESCYIDYAHYTSVGFERIGRHVADYIRKELD